MNSTTILSSIKAAQSVIKEYLYKTPLIQSSELSVQTGNNVYLKLENLQQTHAFKVRGAINKIASLSDEERARGVIAASSGNHAIGVAYASKLFQIHGTVVMPKHAPKTKVDLSRSYGAEVILFGETYDECIKYVKDVSQRTGKILVSSFDDLQVMFGHATIALEVLESVPDVDLFLVPIGGGGLISGICIALSELNHPAKVIGVEADGASSMLASIQAGKVTKLQNVNTIADGIAISEPGVLTFNYVKQYVEKIITVSDEHIRLATTSLIYDNRIVAEPASAAPIAALLINPEFQNRSRKICCIVTGGNISKDLLKQLVVGKS